MPKRFPAPGFATQGSLTIGQLARIMVVFGLSRRGPTMNATPKTPTQPLLFAKRRKVAASVAVQYVGTKTELDVK